MNFDRSDIRRYNDVHDIYDDVDFEEITDQEHNELDFAIQTDVNEHHLSDTVLEVYDSISSYVRNTGVSLCEKLSANVLYNYTEYLIR